MKLRQNVVLRSVREIVFGLEDGIVSTLGVITGIAEGTQDRYTILLAGVVIVVVESLSMAAGSYLSSKSAAQAKSRWLWSPIRSLLHRNDGSEARTGALFMGLAYSSGGIIPVLPYLFLSLQAAFWVSLGASLLVLLGVGAWKAKVTNTSVVQGSLEVAMVSLTAALLGYVVGRLAATWNPQLRLVI